jgi:hypothetical protein
MTPERLRKLLDAFERVSGEGPKMVVSSTSKSKGPVDIEELLKDSDEDEEDKTFKYDKHGNKWAIVKPENSPDREEEDRPYRKEKKETSLLDTYDAGIFKKKKR